MIEDIHFSIAKIEEAIQRLASVSADLSKMIAVHEQRIGTQEKIADSIIASFEKRREEIDNRLKEMQIGLRDELKSVRENSTANHQDQNSKIEALQKYIWMAMGAVLIMSWAAPIIINKFVH